MTPTTLRLATQHVAALSLPCGCLLEHWSDSPAMAVSVVRMLQAVHVCFTPLQESRT